MQRHQLNMSLKRRVWRILKAGKLPTKVLKAYGCAAIWDVQALGKDLKG